MTVKNRMYLSARRSYISEFRETYRDFSSSGVQWQLAWSLAVHDIAARYRGSILGPWWITLSMGALVLGIGINYAALFHMSVEELLPYVAIGIVMWGFVSNCIAEGGDAFVAGGPIIRQSSLPLPIFLIRCYIRNVINLAHHIVIIIAVLVYVHIFPGFGMLLFFAGFVLTSINLGWIMILLAFFASRFRDVPQIVSAVLQITFFLTPVFWKVTPGLAASPVVVYNPFYYAVETMRRPLLGTPTSLTSYVVLLSVAICGWIVAILVYNQTRRKVVHYL